MNQLYRVWARFEPDHVNPLTGRKGQWRVDHCHEAAHQYARPVMKWHGIGAIGIVSTKPYPRGSIIRPHKELNRVLAMRGAA